MLIFALSRIHGEEILLYKHSGHCGLPTRVRLCGNRALISSRNLEIERRRRTNLVPRLFLRGRKDPGRSWSRDAYKIDCLRGYGQSVKLHMLPLPDFTLPLQGVSVLYI